MILDMITSILIACDSSYFNIRLSMRRIESAFVMKKRKKKV
jgi:hypothetical protein